MKKILTSLFVIGVVVAATVGATRAYFTDSKTSEDNVLGAGDFNIRMAGQDADGNRYTNMDGKAFFDVDGLMPTGDIDVEGASKAEAYIDVRNESQADALFRLYAKNVGETEPGLRNYINVRVTLHPDSYQEVLSGPAYGTANNVLGTYKLSDVIGADNALDNYSAACNDECPLNPGYVATYKVEAYLDWDAPDKYQNAELTADLQLDATQFESDEQCNGRANVQW